MQFPSKVEVYQCFVDMISRSLIWNRSEDSTKPCSKLFQRMISPSLTPSGRLESRSITFPIKFSSIWQTMMKIMICTILPDCRHSNNNDNNSSRKALKKNSFFYHKMLILLPIPSPTSFSSLLWFFFWKKSCSLFFLFVLFLLRAFSLPFFSFGKNLFLM